MDWQGFPLIDSHDHVQDACFDADRAAVIRRAATAGVRYMVCNGTREADWPAVLALARDYPEVVPCFGLHPWYVSARSRDWLAVLEDYLRRVPSGVGEIGLDRWLADRDEKAQEEVFREQLGLARRYDRPVMVHCLRAWGWFMDVMGDEAPLPAGMVFHAYSGSAELVAPLAERGAYFSFSGTVLETRHTRQRAAFCAVPRDRLLIESDAPFMPPPAEFRRPDLKVLDGTVRNEPAVLPAILGGIARLRGEPESALAAAVWENGRRFLDIILR